MKCTTSPKAPDAKYKITDISLDYEITTQPDLARSIRSEWAFNTPCKSLKGILVLFEEEGSYTRDTSKFYNPKIQKVSVTVEGKPNQLYA